MVERRPYAFGSDIRQFDQQRHQIYVAGGHIKITGKREEKAVAVSIRDNGMGIPPVMLPKVFDMFVQVESSLARSHGGLGIGFISSQALD